MQEFQVIKPSPFLRPFIKQYWLLKTNTLTKTNQIVFPTGYVNLIFHKGEKIFSVDYNSYQPRSFLCGQLKKYNNLSYNGFINMFTIVFEPHGASRFFKIPLNKLVDSHVSVYDLEDKELIDLQFKLNDIEDYLSGISIIENYFLHKLQTISNSNYERIKYTIEAINRGYSNIKQLSQLSCLSYKQYQRIFSENIGLNPKDFIQIIRFQRALYVMQTQPEINFTHISYECGYYDQSHFNKEFKSMTGLTPKEYLSIDSPFSDYFTC